MMPLAAIVGPTSIGKTSLALELAGRLDAEIVSADSRQVYRYMDIGTAKPTRQQRGSVSHHMIDVVAPDEDYSLALYLKGARSALESLHREGRKALLVGGSGLYVWAMLEGWHVPEAPPDRAFREEMERKAEREGGRALHSELARLDPTAAERVDPRNVRRVIRALEVNRQGVMSVGRRRQRAVTCPVIGLTTSRATLYRTIDERVDRMVAAGLVDEVDQLLSQGYGLDLPSMSGLGYRQIGIYLKGDLGLESAIQRIKSETHRFARHQYNWFSLRDSRIMWFEQGAGIVDAVMESLEPTQATPQRGGRENELVA